MVKRWMVTLSRNALKQAKKLDRRTFRVFDLLVEGLVMNGPVPGSRWLSYGRLVGKKGEDKRHCHLRKGRPTYVCCWSVDKKQRLIEVYYVGTHEKAPY